MASFAGALCVMLEKVGAYRINDGMPGPDVTRLRLALKLFDASIVIALVITLVLLIFRVSFVPLFI